MVKPLEISELWRIHNADNDVMALMPKLKSNELHLVEELNSFSKFIGTQLHLQASLDGTCVLVWM